MRFLPLRQRWFLAVTVGLVSAFAFLPAATNRWVIFDDDLNFTENVFYRGFGWRQIVWAWTSYRVGVYQPLAWMLLEVQYVFCGLDPRAYHVVSIAFHAAVAIALFFLLNALLNRLTGDDSPERPSTRQAASALAALLFAVHPLRTEVVAWASCQPYLPATFCSILAVIAYLNAFSATGFKRPLWSFAAFGLWVAAVLCKAIAITLPVVLVLLDFYPLRRRAPATSLVHSAFRFCVEKTHFFLVACLFIATTALAKMSNDSVSSLEEFGLLKRLLQTCYGVVFYLARTLWPSGLRAYYPLPVGNDFSAPIFLLCPLIVLVLSIGALIMRNRYPGLQAAWLSYLVILAPNAGLMRIGNQLAADRYSYLSVLGLVAVLAHVLEQQLRRHDGRARAIVIVCLVLIAGEIALSWQQCKTWSSTERLWANALVNGGAKSAAVHGNLGMTLADRGALDQAMAHYQEALRLKPSYASAHNLMGVALEKRGRLQEAMDEYAMAVRFQPKYPEAHNNLGSALARSGRLSEAISHFQMAIDQRPDYSLAHRNMGLALLKVGNTQRAFQQFADAVRFAPEDAKSRQFLGRTLAELGQIDEAARILAEAVRLAPSAPDVHHDLGMILAELGRRNEAASQFREVLRLRPDHPSARQELDAVLKGVVIQEREH